MLKFHRLSLFCLCALALGKAPYALAQTRPLHVVEDQIENNYDFRCSLHLNGGTILKGGTSKSGKSATGSASILLGYKPGQPHLALTLSKEALTLARVSGAHEAGKTLLLARQRYLAPGAQDMPLVIQWRAGTIRVIYNDRMMLRLNKLGTTPGALALATQGGNWQFIKPQYQPVEPIQYADDFMRSASVPGLWEPASGAWRLNFIGDPTRGTNPFTYLGSGKDALSVAGRWFWSDYVASVSARPSGKGAVGIAVYWQDAANYLVFKWYADGDARWRGKEKQLWSVLHGKPTLLAAAPGGYYPKQWYRLATAAHDGLVQVSVDGAAVLKTATNLFGQGKVGLYSDGDTGTTFDDVEVHNSDVQVKARVAPTGAITPQFAEEQSMEDWSTHRGEWEEVKNDAGTTLWNRGAFFGHHTVEAKATGMLPSAKLTVISSGDGETPGSGYALTATPLENGHSVSVTLLRQGNPTASAQTATLPVASVCRLALERDGGSIRGLVNSRTVVTFDDPKPLTGSRAGYSVQNAQVALADANVSGDHIYDYTFYQAPVDWYIGSGNWDVTSRWICSPQWTWYGGWSDRIAALWSKHNFSGDYVVEVFAASKMDSLAAPYYLHPRDFNITVAGDGNDLGSGYSCIYGGWNNTFTRILRGTRIVAETKDVLLPADYHAVAHHKWFYLRVEKTGGTISFFVDRKLALRYKDPSPLSGHKIALWTYGNGITMARATIYYEKEVGAQSIPRLTAATDAPFYAAYAAATKAP